MAIGDGASSVFALADATDRGNRLAASDDPWIGAAAGPCHGSPMMRAFEPAASLGGRCSMQRLR
ncbi:MAG: hypothetical protein ACRDN1_03735, partial [Trebonia sp.]